MTSKDLLVKAEIESVINGEDEKAKNFVEDPVIAMTNNEALLLLKAWAGEVRDPHYAITLKLGARGDFLAKSKGAFFRYAPESGSLIVSGLVGHGVTLHSKYPKTWERLLRAGQREWATLGDGAFELYREPLYELKPDVILLSKTFGNSISEMQFIVQVRWLLDAATHWRTLRYNRVMQDPESDLIREGAIINERMQKERPRPW